MVIELLAADATEPLLKRLDPELRAKVVLTLLGLILLGLALMIAVWMGGRRVRRVAAKRIQPPHGRTDAWAKKPIVTGNDESAADASDDPSPPK